MYSVLVKYPSFEMESQVSTGNMSEIINMANEHCSNYGAYGYEIYKERKLVLKCTMKDFNIVSTELH